MVSVTALLVMMSSIGSANVPKSQTAETCAFSSARYAAALREAVLSEDFERMAKLAGGEKGPGAPHADFIRGGANSAEGAVPFRQFLAGEVSILTDEVIHQGRHTVRIRFYDSKLVKPIGHWVEIAASSGLVPYRDYYVCELQVEDCQPYMPDDFCFSESDVLMDEEH